MNDQGVIGDVGPNGGESLAQGFTDAELTELALAADPGAPIDDDPVQHVRPAGAGLNSIVGWPCPPIEHAKWWSNNAGCSTVA